MPSFNLQESTEVIQTCFSENLTFDVQMVKEFTKINRKKIHGMLGEGLKREKSVCSFRSSFTKQVQKRQRAASFVEFVQTIYGDRMF
jgi:hypothetical protein